MLVWVELPVHLFQKKKVLVLTFGLDATKSTGSLAGKLQEGIKNIEKEKEELEKKKQALAELLKKANEIEEKKKQLEADEKKVFVCFVMCFSHFKNNFFFLLP